MQFTTSQFAAPSSRGMFSQLGVNDYASNVWFPPTVQGASALAAGAGPNAGVIALIPFFCRYAHTFTGIGIVNSTIGDGTSHQVRLGIYGSANGRPANNLILDAGPIDANDSSNNVLRSLTISQALAANTLYFLAMIPAVNSSTLGWWGYSAAANLDVLMEGGVKNAIVSATQNLPCFTGTQAYGALPANLPTLTEAAITACAAIQLKG